MVEMKVWCCGWMDVSCESSFITLRKSVFKKRKKKTLGLFTSFLKKKQKKNNKPSNTSPSILGCQSIPSEEDFEMILKKQKLQKILVTEP